jgi:hypothetical protein
MPIVVSSTAGGTVHAPVFVGDILGTDVVQCDISDLTTKEVDADGNVRPGVPFAKDGSLVGSGVAVWGVTIEATKIKHATMPPTDVSLAADTGTAPVVVGFGLCNRDVMEDNLERALTADEIAGFDLAGSNCRITRT